MHVLAPTSALSSTESTLCCSCQPALHRPPLSSFSHLRASPLSPTTSADTSAPCARHAPARTAPNWLSGQRPASFSSALFSIASLRVPRSLSSLPVVSAMASLTCRDEWWLHGGYMVVTWWLHGGYMASLTCSIVGSSSTSKPVQALLAETPQSGPPRREARTSARAARSRGNCARTCHIRKVGGYAVVTRWLHGGYAVVTRWLRGGYAVATRWLRGGGSAHPVAHHALVLA